MVLSGIDQLSERAHSSLKCRDKSHHHSLSLASLTCDSSAIYFSYLRLNVKLIPFMAHIFGSYITLLGVSIIDS